MDFKQYCKDNVDRKFCEITSIKETDIKIDTNPIQTIKDNWIILLGIITLIIGFLLIKFNLAVFLVCIGFAILFVALFVIGNKYTVICNKNDIEIKQYFQKTKLAYKDVKNVYIERAAKGIFMRTYVLVIKCEDKLSLLREFEFPLLCCNPDDAIKFVENFKCVGECDEDSLRLDRKRSLRRIANNAFKLMCAIIIVWFCIVKGIIKLPH